MKFIYTSLFFLCATTYSFCQKDTIRPKPAIQDSSGYNIPPKIGWTSDYFGLYTKQEIQILDSLIAEYEKKTSIEIAILTIDSSKTTIKTFGTYAGIVFRTWGLGKKKINNGILILIVPDLRRIRIENGYGIEKVMSDEETKSIMDNFILPKFKTGEYYSGTVDGLTAIMKHLNSRLELII
jgi:uncharacterized protein